MPRAIRYLLILILVLAISFPLAGLFLVQSGLADRPLRRLVVAQIDKATGGRAEMKAFHFRLWGLRAEMDGFTLHGRELPDEAPLFRADQIIIRARLLSFWGHRVALDAVEVEHPAVAVRIDAHGESNLPIPPVRKTTRPWREELFNLEIGHLELNNGQVAYGNRRIPLNVRGDDFHFAMTFDAPALGKEFYVGTLAARRTEVALKQDAPFLVDTLAKFTLTRDTFSLDELQLNTGSTEIHLRAELASFAQPSWTYHSRVRLALSDVGQIFRVKEMPDGIVDATGAGSYEDGRFTLDGHYEARKISTSYVWFHAKDMESWGRLTATEDRLELPKFEARAFGGALQGRLQLNYKGLVVRTETQLRGANLAKVFDAVNNSSLPIDTLHWNGSMAVNSINEWSGAFKHFRTRGHSTWTPASNLSPGQFPASAQLQFDYSDDTHIAMLAHGKISTPDSTLLFSGTLAKNDSALETELTANHLLDWDDFINDLRGPDSTPVSVSGEAHWRGRILGPIVGPNFVGHFQAEQAQYGRLYWDTIAGDMDYSPDGLQLKNAHITSRGSTVDMNLSLSFDGDWGFLPNSPWSAYVHAMHTPIDGLQVLLGTDYPVTALLSGDFEGSGTRADPELAGDFRADELVLRGVHFDEVTGRVDLQTQKFCVQQVHMAIAGGHIAGQFCYLMDERATDFTVDGGGISLARLTPRSMGQFAPGGTIDLHAQGHGPLAAPVGNGRIHIQGMTFGPEIEGDLAATFNSDGEKVQMEIDSLAQWRLHANLSAELSGDYPVVGNITGLEMDLDPVIEYTLHLQNVTGHSSVDGSFTISGSLRQPETITVSADISRLSMDYENVSLQNEGPLRLKASGQGVQIEQMNLHGPNSDFRLAGQAHFKGDKALNLRVDGTVNLRLLHAFIPDLDAHGAADMRAGITGTLSQPEITGQIRVNDASAEYGDFPVGLSRINGSLVFDRRSLIFENVTAQAGGGNLTLSGSVGYSASPLRFEVNTTATNVRVRYPAGLSWTGSASLKLSGTRDAGLLSGTVTANRLLISPNAGLATFLSSAGGPSVSVPSSSPFLRNLQFDVVAQTGSGARLEATGARVDMEGSVRLRGTWDHPVLLGNVHVLSGDLNFNGTNYSISRGDINFANPFRLDPILDVEASTTIQQYVITVDFSGPVSHLSLSYRADPPLPQADVIALLAVGSTGEENALRSATGSQSQNYGASALLSAAISNQLGGRIERLFGISRFRVDPFLAGTTTDQNAGARVTIEQQVTRNLTVTYSTNATANQQQVIQIEYALNPRVSLVALRDINGIYSVDVKFKKRFK